MEGACADLLYFFISSLIVLSISDIYRSPYYGQDTYKYRHREKYNGVNIDVKANTSAELIERVRKKKSQINRATISPDIKLLSFGDMFLKTYKKNFVSLLV